MVKRDLKADLEICKAATRGPWYVVHVDDDVCMNAFAVSTAEQIADFTPDFGDEDKVVAITLLQSPLFAAVHDERWFENAAFIATAREGWPEAIERAMEAEDKLRQLVTAADAALIALRTSQRVDAAIQREPEVLAALKRLDQAVLAVYEAGIV